MQEIINNFRHHANEEEESQLPALQRALVNEELVKMGKDFDLAKKASRTQPHRIYINTDIFIHVILK